jgi:hypothetical protein
VSFDYPTRWGRSDQGNQLVVSPHAATFLGLFTRPGQPEPWAEVGRVLREDRGGAIGMYTFFNQVDYGTPDWQQTLEQTLRSNLPDQVSFDRPQPDAALGKVPAIRISGELDNPDDSAAQLRFACYITHVDAPEPRNVHMIFFSDGASFDRHRPTFDRIAASAVPHG